MLIPFLKTQHRAHGISVGLALLVLACAFLIFSRKPEPLPSLPKPPLFSAEFPVDPRFSREINSLLTSQQLSRHNHRLISSSVMKASQALEMPPALLWCLLFQESRFNHLAGINESPIATGLGQFSFSAFYEINHQLDRYLPSPKRTLVAMLGEDVRPIVADAEHPNEKHSYYNIPTAVTASALYLHNRKIQLERVLQSRNLEFNSELIWFWAAISYNKGTRTVISLWNQIQKAYGEAGLSERLTEPELLMKTIEDRGLLFSAVKTIWQSQQAKAFTEELWRHSKSLKECSLNSAAISIKETDR
ncbi:MAG: hypothetical protein EB078_10725 [Proteobacteria bacterium]|nr:hypothetical protein [Pseudomonadota bacterium]NDC25858.1 hypothetical protein [Pseudomonadota bacterium]NDD05370.1 hypothetical protein [Pseudomonadota bacterium]NDG27927.1 hypothetical protein [Pseudomonadota bacterium]